MRAQKGGRPTGRGPSGRPGDRSGCTGGRRNRGHRKGSLDRVDVVAAHRTQKNPDTGLGTPRDFSDKALPASPKTYVLKPDPNAVGGLVNEEGAHEAPDVRACLASRH